MNFEDLIYNATILYHKGYENGQQFEQSNYLELYKKINEFTLIPKINELLVNSEMTKLVGPPHQRSLTFISWVYDMDNLLYKVLLFYVSKILNVYTIVEMEVPIDSEKRWEKSPSVVANSNDFSNLKFKLINEVCKTTDYYYLPYVDTQYKLKDIAFQNINKGLFTLFNAYFDDEIYFY